MDVIDELLQHPFPERRAEVLNIIRSLHNQEGSEAVTSILSLLPLLCSTRAACEMAAELAGAARDTLQLIADESSAKAAQWAIFLTAAAGLTAAGDLASEDLQLLHTAVQRARSEGARKAANTRHAPNNQQKAAALAAWEANSVNLSSMAAFARSRHKDFGVTERTLYNWIRDHRKTTT